MSQGGGLESFWDGVSWAVMPSGLFIHVFEVEQRAKKAMHRENQVLSSFDNSNRGDLDQQPQCRHANLWRGRVGVEQPENTLLPNFHLSG